ncbi:hypothetical protein FKM82_022784 [Ascaphus truei]
MLLVQLWAMLLVQVWAVLLVQLRVVLLVQVWAVQVGESSRSIMTHGQLGGIGSSGQGERASLEYPTTEAEQDNSSDQQPPACKQRVEGIRNVRFSHSENYILVEGVMASFSKLYGPLACKNINHIS